MKTFKYKFTALQKALIIIGILLSAGGFAVNLAFFIRDGVGNAASPVYPILQFALMLFVTLAAFTLFVSILLCSHYTLDGKTFKTRFGIVVSKYDVEKITNLTLDRKTKKLTVTFESGEFMVIVVKQEWYEDFIGAMLEANPKIDYGIISLDSSNPDEKDKQDK